MNPPKKPRDEIKMRKKSETWNLWLNYLIEDRENWLESFSLVVLNSSFMVAMRLLSSDFSHMFLEKGFVRFQSFSQRVPPGRWERRVGIVSFDGNMWQFAITARNEIRKTLKCFSCLLLHHCIIHGDSASFMSFRRVWMWMWKRSISHEFFQFKNRSVPSSIEFRGIAQSSPELHTMFHGRNSLTS